MGNSRENYIYPNRVPGELIYTGEYTEQTIKLALIVYDKEKVEFKEIKGIDEIPSTSSVIWLNIIGLHNIKLIKEIGLIYQYFQILGVVSSKIDDIEEQVIEEKEVPLEAIYSLKKEMLLLKSAVFPIKDTLISFLANDMEYISDEVTKYFKDVEDHLKHSAETIITYREMVMSLSETQMSNISNKMNKIMTTLTFFSVIFIPLSFLTGVFGMNFIYMPGLDNHQAFIYFCLACLIISGGMLTFFKVNKWF